MDDVIVAVRLEQQASLLFCHAQLPLLEVGMRVRVALPGEVMEGIVAIASGQILAAPPLPDAPRVIAAMSREPGAGAPLMPPDGVDFLPADGAEIGPRDLANALRLATLPLPDAPPERR